MNRKNNNGNNTQNLIEGYCPCNVGRNAVYDDFDDNIVEEGFAKTRARYDSVKGISINSIENYTDGPRGDYYNMNGKSYIYNREAEARGSPMGIPIQSQLFGNNTPCKDVDARSLYDKQGYTSEGFTREGYIPPMPQYAPLWAPSYVNYLSKMPPTVRPSITDPDNRTSYMYGKNYKPSNVYNCGFCPKDIWLDN